LDGQGGAESFADYAQWESWQAERPAGVQAKGRPELLAPRASEPAPQVKKKLSYLEAREYASIEQRIAEAEQVLEGKRAELENPAIASDGPRLVEAHAEMEAAQKVLDALYTRWAELEERAGNMPQSRTR
jgi:ATP-binding cassette subfamily F protein uup